MSLPPLSPAPAPHITSMSPRGRAWLAALEGGHRLEAYFDRIGGVWTIGAGLTRYAGGRRVLEHDRFDTLDEAKQAFRSYLVRFELDVDALTRDDLLQREFDALVALCWNIGPQLQRATVIGRINAHATPEAIAEAWGWWHYANGQSVPGLITRRKREIEVFEGGEYREQAGIVIPAVA